MQSTSAAHFKKEVWISKTLSWLLRHGALEQGLKISSDGFIPVKDILNTPTLKSKCTIDDIKHIVATNNKQRFTLRTTDDGILEIRANQGHSINVANLQLTPITDSKQFENIIHGTYFKLWKSIKKNGLHRGKRNHIHFTFDCFNKEGVISGMRATSEIYIYINIAKAFAAGLLFFLSSNKVILSPGNDDGYIKPEFFLKAIRVCDNIALDF